MSPPIYTPDGTEVSEIVLPDGSTASEVIGPGGNVVFEAGPDIPDSAISRFTFDTADISASTLTDVWGSNDLTLNGVTTGVLGANQTYTTNEAADGDGVDDDATASGFTGTDIQSFSVAAWVNVDAWEGGRPIVERFQNSDSTGWQLRASNNEITFNVRDSSNNELVASTANSYATDVWIHAVGVVDGDEVLLYADGSLQDSLTGASNRSISTRDVLGFWSRTSVGDRYLDATIDDTRLYSKALTSTEVSNLYNSGAI